jgi:hypothetical protein
MFNPLRDSQLLNLGLDQDGIVHLRDCYAAGVSDEKLRWLVKSGRWRLVHPRTIAVFSGPMSYRSSLRAAVIYAGEDAVLSHATAGHEYGLCARPPLVHLSVPYAREVDARPGIKLHRSRTLSTGHVAAGSLAFTTIERTVLDLLAALRSADAALGLVGEAVRSRRTTPRRLRAALASAPCTRWRKVVIEAMPDVERGAQSPLELRDARMRRRHGLPAGTRQLQRLAGGVEMLDVVVAEWGVHVELDGRLGHDGTRERWRDMRRDNRSEVGGLRHLRYGWADMVDRPCAVAAEQALVLRQQGWPGPFKPCPTCPSPLPPGL